MWNLNSFLLGTLVFMTQIQSVSAHSAGGRTGRRRASVGVVGPQAQGARGRQGMGRQVPWGGPPNRQGQVSTGRWGQPAEQMNHCRFHHQWQAGISSWDSAVWVWGNSPGQTTTTVQSYHSDISLQRAHRPPHQASLSQTFELQSTLFKWAAAVSRVCPQ